MRARRPILAAVTAATAACSGSDPLYCDPAALTAALAAATPGTTVQLGSCTISGAFTVPAGVTLAGAGEGSSIIDAPPGMKALQLTLADNTPATRVSGLTLDAHGPAGIVARGSGRAAIGHVTVNADRGVAIGAESSTELTIDNVTLLGPVTQANADAIADPPSANDTATYGLVLIGVASATLSGVTARGFASAGVLFAGSMVHWNGGSASENLGLGIAVESGSTELVDVEACRTLQGFRLIAAFGGVFTATASVHSTRLRACENEGYGVLHLGGSAMHENLDAHDNAEPGLWLQRAGNADISGSVRGNMLAGIVAVDSPGLHLHDATIENTQTAITIFEETGALRIGDGLHLVRSSTGTVVNGVMLSGNERTGALVELGGGRLETTTFSNVTVTVTSTSAHGVIVQNGTIASGWDSAITRMGVTAADDANVPRLSHVEVVGPCEHPRASGAMQGGLTALIGP